jgi:hypothetical protein
MTPVSATTVPEGAEEIGILEAHGRRPVARFDELLNEFRARIVSMGGNFGRIDQFPTGSWVRPGTECLLDQVLLQSAFTRPDCECSLSPVETGGWVR